jgi:hypothetical protein
MTTIEAVAELRKEFARRGWDKKATNRIVFELSIHVAIAVGGAPTSGWETVTGHSIKWTGPFGASCSYGSGVSISAAGGLPRNDGDITFFMNDVGCTAW